MVCTECGTRIKDTAKSCAMCGVKIINPERRNSDLADNVALGVNSELLGRYSEAGKQFKVAYDGIDNETGQKLHQGLKKISQGKVHPDYKEANINQQAGYSAEVLDTAKQNAENIKSGNEKRVSRTDDLGRVNDTKADQVTLDRHGNVVDGSEVQMKFLGVDKKGNLEFLKKVSGKEYSEHYPDGNFRVPSDQYDAIKTGLGEKIQSLENQSPLTPEKQRQLEYLKKVNKNLKKSTVSKNEAVEARKNPEKVTVNEIAKTSHEAGVEAVKTGVLIGGGISVITNSIAVLKGEKTPADAVTDVTKNTAVAGAASYATGFANTALASVMKNSGNNIVRSLGKASAPAYVIQTAISTAKSLGRLCSEQISINEFFLEIGKNGTGLLASVKGAAIGFALGGPVGALVGGLASTLLCGVIYDYTVGMRLLSEEIDQFTNQLSMEIDLLKQYQARLMSFDIDKFRSDTQRYCVVSNFMEGEHSQQDFNTMLKATYVYLGIPCPWGGGSFDEFMNNKERTLTFG